MQNGWAMFQKRCARKDEFDKGHPMFGHDVDFVLRVSAGSLFPLEMHAPQFGHHSLSANHLHILFSSSRDSCHTDPNATHATRKQPGEDASSKQKGQWKTAGQNDTGGATLGLPLTLAKLCWDDGRFL